MALGNLHCRRFTAESEYRRMSWKTLSIPLKRLLTAWAVLPRRRRR